MAIAVLVAQGKLPRPEMVVIADTGYEASETWEYTKAHVDPLLATVGLEVEVAPHSLATVGLYAKNGDILIPAFTKDGGKLPTLCSNEWKKRVVQRYLRSKSYGPKNPATMWLGISVDEIHRAKPSGLAWLEYDWPLLMTLPHRRDECQAVVVNAGLPHPPRSSCWMCPHRTNHEWRHIRENYPADYAKAVALEAKASKADEAGGVFLHRDRVPLPMAKVDNEGQTDAFDECDSGFCFV